MYFCTCASSLESQSKGVFGFSMALLYEPKDMLFMKFEGLEVSFEKVHTRLAMGLAIFMTEVAALEPERMSPLILWNLSI